VVDFLRETFQAFASWLLNSVFYVFSWLGGWLSDLLVWLASALVELLPSDTAAYLSQNAVGSIAPYIALARYWLPFDSVMGILATTLALVGLIRFGRWCFAFIPTLGG